MVLKVLLLVLVVMVLAGLLKTRRRPDKPARPARRGGPAPQPMPLPMLACARCGVHLPQVEALVDRDGRGFCCEAHRVAGPV